MKRMFKIAGLLLFMSGLVSAKTIYVSPTGSDSGAGSEGAPYASIQKAVDEAQPGDMIYLRGGTYMLTKRIKIEKAGTADARISMFAYPGEKPVLDGSTIPSTSINEFKQSRCIYVNHFGDYWHFKGLEMCNANDNGMKMEGSYNIIENCKFHDNNDTGLQIGMYKDFAIEETQSFPITGEPQFNPGFSYCKYNVVINCDSWYNYDGKSFGGTDDGGDADGFACKLFPGPGTEFHGCRAWNNSDDNWDLYMVYHPIMIDQCWNWNGGKDKTGTSRGNGNGFKLGGGGTSGGAAFPQSVGAHVVKNCVTFNCTAKGYDQNNAYEAMYLFNNVAWGNAYNYRFPTVMQYGTMYLRNCVGFKPTMKNHEFFASNPKPNSTFCSWITFDGCDYYKDGNKVNGVSVTAKDHSAQFLSLSETLAAAERQADGSLPDNDFVKLVNASKFIDSGEKIENVSPAATSPGGLTLPSISILYNDVSADMGAKETGVPTTAILALTGGKANQYVFTGTAITETIYKWGGAATDVTVTNLPAGLTATTDVNTKTVTISGIPTAEGTYSIVNVGGTNTITLTGEIKISTVAAATMAVTSGKAAQEVNFGNAIETTVITWGGGATDVTYTAAPAGINVVKDDVAKTLTISGTPTADGSFVVSTVGGMEGSQVDITCGIIRVLPTKILTGDWYKIQDEYAAIPADLQGVVSFGSGDLANPTAWNPTYSEGGTTVPAGCTAGAVNIERSKGYIEWVLPNLVELKANLHFTGTRTFQIDYTIGGVTKSTNVSYAKSTLLNWDLMLACGLEPTKKPVTIRFYNTATSGGIRMYDFFVKVYDVPAAIGDVKADKVSFDMYQTESALVVNGEIAALKVMSITGAVLTESQQSQIVEIGSLKPGVYIVMITDKAGATASQKFIKK